MNLDRKIKIALDETRLMILGSQVLFGFLCQAAFQEGFNGLTERAQFLLCCALILMTLSIGCLIAPSMQHRIVEAGQSTRRLEKSTTLFAAWSLLPMAFGLGLALFVVCENLVGRATAVSIGLLTTLFAGGLWYALPFLIGRTEGPMATHEGTTPLATRVEQMLTEARVVIPGCQAMLGFQFVVILTRAFGELPMSVKTVHIAGLCCVTLATILLMTPAALHRQAFGGNDSATFLRIGSAFVMGASLPLAAGIALDIYVVLYRVAESTTLAATVSTILFGVMLLLWYLHPLWVRMHLPRQQTQ